MNPPIDAAARGCSLGPQSCYRRVLAHLERKRVPYLVGGAYAFRCLTGIKQRTKDIDLFVRQRHCERLLHALEECGYLTAMAFPHWLAKGYCGDHFIDVIFNSGNGEAPVDDEWFGRAQHGEVLGVPVRLCPVEETILSKAFIMERERYDGADIAHLIRACAERIDWQHLLARFGRHWMVLLSHLILFGYVYPGERARVPADFVRGLVERLVESWRNTPEDAAVCNGGLLSRSQYLVDLVDWHYADGRVRPYGRMTPEEVAVWTAAAPAKPRDGGKVP